MNAIPESPLNGNAVEEIRPVRRKPREIRHTMNLLGGLDGFQMPVHWSEQAREEMRGFIEAESSRIAEAEEKQRRAKRAQDTARQEAWWSQTTFTNGYKVFAYEYFTRAIRGHLTPAEQSLFFLIFDRTVWWLKEWETIRLSQFTGGSLPDEDGFRAFSGTGLKRSTVIETLKGLVADGLVRRREKPGGNGLVQYALPEVHRVRDLPRFAGVNIAYRGWLWTKDGKRVQVTL